MNQLTRLTASRPVKIDLSALEAALDDLPDVKIGTKSFPWTPELDDILLRYWNVKPQRDICRLIGCTDNTARNRWRLLQAQQGKGDA